MRPLRLLAPSLLACALVAAEPAPIAEVRMANGVDLIAHWDASLVGQAWQDPANERVRAMWAEQMHEIKQKVGFTPVELIAAMSQADLRVVSDGTVVDKPSVLAQVDLGALAEPLWALVTKEGKLESVTVAGADAAVAFSESAEWRALLARFGSTLVLGFNAADPVKPGNLPKPTADLTGTLHMAGFIELMDGLAQSGVSGNAEGVAAMRKQFAELGLTKAVYSMALVPEGIRERFESDNRTNPGMTPVDRTVLGLLPATTLMAVAVGFDGKAYWAANRDQLAASAMDLQTNAGMEVTVDQAFTKANELLNSVGITSTVEQLVEGVSGTCVFALTPGMPMPGMTFALPRSPALDQALGVGAQQLQADLPKEGESVALPIPNLPMPLTIACAKGHWVITTDLQLGNDWLAGTPGGWNDTEAAKTAFAVAPKDAYLIGASDTPQVLRMVSGYLGMGLAFAKDLPPADKQAILGAVNRLAAKAATGYLVAGSGGLGQMVEGRGVMGAFAGPFAVIGGVGGTVAYFNSRQEHDAPVAMNMDADPAVATATLKSSIFPAQVQFQVGAYVDNDGNGRGAYGTLPELGGLAPINHQGKNLNLITPKLASGVDQGWAYQVYLPLGDNDAISGNEGDGVRPVEATHIDQETRFVCYAWPADAFAGLMFAIDATGTVYSAPFTGGMGMPEWYALYGEPTWSGTPVWTKYDAKAKVVPPAKPVAPAGEPLM